MGRNVLQSSVLNAGFNIIFQIFCRILTFGINAFIVRNVGREVLGIMNVRLLLLESTLLFLSREAINRAALSATTQNRDKCSWSQLINQMWLPVLICTGLSAPLVYIWLYSLAAVDEVFQDQYRFACYAVALSCIVELCAEAPVFLAQLFCFVKVRVVLNTLHIFVRSVIFLYIVIGNSQNAIYAFAIAQVASAVTIFLGYYIFFHVYIKRFNLFKTREGNGKSSLTLSTENDNPADKVFENMDDFPFVDIRQLLPGMMHNTSTQLNKELQILTLSFAKQGVLKQILTEGEKYVMSVSPVLSFSEQATYDVVNNLGSLAARFIFRPIEENSYFYFTQTVARDIPLHNQDQQKVMEVGNVLRNLSLAVTSIGLLALTFGQSYSHHVLLLYGGEAFVAGGLPERLLQWHCLAILFLAVNGITEGYMFATNTSADIDKYNYLMGLFSVSFLVLSHILTNALGPVGFIFANCINMFCRICYSIRFIWKQFKPVQINSPLLGLVPGKYFALSLLLLGLLCKYSMHLIHSILLQLTFGFGAAVVCLAVWSVENIQLIKVLLKKYGKQKEE